MKIIKSYIAHRNWVKAHSLMASQFHSLALETIRNAVKIEPDERKIANYLELQGHIEISIGKSDLALKSFKLALEIIEKYSNNELIGLKKNIIKSIKEIKNGLYQC